ncbi:MAG: hypothetical protein APF80_05730 [Alphaproteobacteria bacterium BRH_c36]|nr:MAG: hypothetical protein APF80_05730 [Alphaproteobacteria bacterium BRH_c36]
MKKTAFILAAIVGATAAFATAPAEAGPRLQFGGPLGSFEATPYAKSSRHGHNSHSSQHSSHRAAKAAAQRAAAKKAYARKLAAQKAAKEAAARKYAAQKAAQEKLAAQKLAAKRAATERIAAKKAAAAKKLSLAQREQPKDEPIASPEPTSVTNKVAPVRASAIAGTNTLKFDRNEAELAALPEPKPATAAAGKSAAEPVQDEVDEKAELECKKYIPSAGLTITVPCGS